MPPLEHVIAAVADERVVERVAGGIDVVHAGQRQVLDVVAERIADAGLHRVGACAGARHRIAAASTMCRLPVPPLMASLPAPPLSTLLPQLPSACRVAEAGGVDVTGAGQLVRRWRPRVEADAACTGMLVADGLDLAGGIGDV